MGGWSSPGFSGRCSFLSLTALYPLLKSLLLVAFDRPVYDFEILATTIMADSVVLHEDDYCFTHCKKCRRLPGNRTESPEELSLCVAGSPCIDWSPFGARKGTSGKSTPAFVVLLFACNI